MSKIHRHGGGDNYSDFVEYNGVVTLRGVTSSDQSQPITQQTEDCLRQIDDLLTKAGTSKSDLLTSTIYLANMGDKDGMNAAWRAWVDPQAKPTRATVQTALGTPRTLIEIVVSAAK